MANNKNNKPANNAANNAKGNDAAEGNAANNAKGNDAANNPANNAKGNNAKGNNAANNAKGNNAGNNAANNAKGNNAKGNNAGNNVANNAKGNNAANNAKGNNAAEGNVANNAKGNNAKANNAGKGNNAKANNAKGNNAKANNAGKGNNAKANNATKANKTLEQLPDLEKQDFTEELMDKIDELKEDNKLYKYIGIAVVVIILIIIGIYIYTTRKEEAEVKVFLEKQNSQNKYIFDSDFVTLPKNGYDYSINFWFYLIDYYENYNKWRHVFHKGHDNDGNIDFSDWDDLSQSIQEQSPGVWLHPNKNNLRLAFTVELNKDFCSTNTQENSCLDKTYCSWDGLSCKPKKEHAFTDMEETDYKDTDKVIIEYVDIENIPSKTMFNIGFTLEQKILNVYINGKLHTVKKFLGVPVFNREDLHFNIKDTYGGSIYQFRYLSNTINAEKMISYYEKIPNVSTFSKTYRIKKYASNFMFGELIKTLFI